VGKMENDFSPGRFVAKLIFLISIIFSIFQLYTAGAGTLTAMLQRTVHLTFVLVLIFLAYPSSQRYKWLRHFDYIFAVASVSSGIYIMLTYRDLLMRVGAPNTTDFILGSILIILILEGTRRTTGWALTVVAICALVYSFVGNLIPGVFGHRGYSLERVINHLYLTTEGIFGVTLGVAATYVVLFILFGAFLQKSGGAQVFMDLAYALAGRARGGPAKVAVIASSLMGTINGSPVANVVTTGTFTIPLMKKIGYKPEVAASIEAVASSGGAIMPPVMGAGAFIMAEFTGIPYSQIVLAAAIPALLYFLGVFFSVDFEACKYNMKGLPKEELPHLWPTIKKGLSLFIPLGILLYLLLGPMVSPMRAAFWSIVSIIVFNLLLGGENRFTFKTFLEALESGAKGTLMVSVACTAAGIVVGVVTLTGVGLAFTNLLLEIAGQWLMIALVTTMVGTIIIGMGLPPAASYIVVSAMAAPALVKVGLTPLVANLFIFYFTAFAPITPPVALGAYAGSGIAGSDPLKTAFTAFRIGIAGFIVPFMFVYGPGLVAQAGTSEILISMVSAGIGVLGLAAFAVGWWRHPLNLLGRLVCFASALLMIKQGIITDIAGLAALLAVYLTPQGLILKRQGNATQRQA